MPYIIPNTTAAPQTVSAAQIVVSGTTCTWPADKIVEGVKVIHHIECSIGTENTGTIPAELKFTLQRDIGEGWEGVVGEVACYTVAVGDDARRKANFKVPYYNGISGLIPRYRLLAECPVGEVTLHRAEGRNAVPTVICKQEHEFEGEPPVVEEIVFALELENVGSPAGTGAIWGESNTNRHFLSIGGNRFVWAGSRRPGGQFPKAQTVVGSVAEDGQVTFGTLSEDTLAVNALSSNTYGVCSVGNNKFARYIQSNDGYGFAVWDCGVSGLSATLLTNNYLNGVNTILAGGWRDCIIHSAGKMYIVAGDYAPDYNRCRMQVCDISNVSGVTSNRVDIDNIFGLNRTVYYYSGEQGEMQGRAIPGGGAMWIVKTSDMDESSNPKMEIMISDGLSVNRYQCADTDGDPLGLAVADDGVFAFAYRIVEGKIRVRVGKLTGAVPSFGNSFDIYEGYAGQSLFYADIGIVSISNFLLVIQNNSTGINRQHYIAFNTDGINVSCDDTFGVHAMQSVGYGPVMVSESGFDSKVIIGNYGRTGSFSFPVVDSKYVSIIGMSPDPVVLENGIPLQCSTIGTQSKFFAIQSSIYDTQLTVTLTNISIGGNVDLYVRKNLRPNDWDDYDCASWESGSDDETCVLSNTEECVWYIGVFGYVSDSDCTVTATLT